MKKEIIIVGGGIIGLSCAYFLNKSGHKVTVIDQSKMDGGASYVNAGYLAPSHMIPLAAPGVMKQGIKWMFRSESPFYVKPRMNSALMAWGWKFYKAANQQQADRAMPVLRDISLFSKQLYQELSTDWADFNYEEKGLLMLFQSAKMAEEEEHLGQLAKKMGLQVDFLDRDGVQKLESGVEVNAIGGVHYKSDAHLYPNKLMAFLHKELVDLKVEFRSNTEIIALESGPGKITQIITKKEAIRVENVVIASGAWSAQLAKMADEKLHLLPGKGYSFTQTTPKNRPTIPSILCEGKVAVTPMGTDLRFGGTMEITHVKDDSINRKRVAGIVNTINAFYPELEVEVPPNEKIWKGFRPCAADGLPYIGRSQRHSNLYYATGHGMMGLSLAPATGKLIEQLITESTTELNTDPFRINR